MMKMILLAGVAILVLTGSIFATEVEAKSVPLRGKPTPEQIAWHEMEVTMFIHISPATWQGRKKDNRSTPLSKLTLEKLDTDQWCGAAKSFGAKQIVFVAKHVGGFCWWQTESTEYGIKNTPYKDGKGDVLTELSESCKKYDLKLGVYLYPGNTDFGARGGGRTSDPSLQAKSDKMFRQQLTEVLSRYGKIDEVWFDGGCVIEVGDILKKYAPKAMVFQGQHRTLRWPGNEHGHSPYPAWQAVKREHAASGVATSRHGDPDGGLWIPMEMDTTLLDKSWFWKPDWDDRIKSLDMLMDIYYKSVGRGGVLLLNASPDTTGLIPESHMKRYREFGRAIKSIYENKKGETSGKGNEFTVMFDRPTVIDQLITMEDIRHGQIVRAYQVEGLIDDKWQTLHEGISVGYKQIDVIDPVKVKGVRLTVTKAVDEPQIKSFAVYNAGNKFKVKKDSAAKNWQMAADIPLGSTWQFFDVDLTRYIPDVGQYEVEIKPAKDCELKRVVVVMEKVEAPRLITKLNRPNAWNINRTAVVTPDEDGRTILRIEAKGKNATVYIRAVD
jgi:alpha-L-fucosidase